MLVVYCDNNSGRELFSYSRENIDDLLSAIRLSDGIITYYDESDWKYNLKFQDATFKIVEDENHNYIEVLYLGFEVD